MTEDPHPSAPQSVVNVETSTLTVANSRRLVLSADWFGSIVARALRQALRRTEYLTLATIRAAREQAGWTVDVGAPAHSDIAEVVAPTIRETDFIGELDDGRLGLLLLQADKAAALRIIQRFGETLGDVQFSVPLAFLIGAACCPTNGVDMRALLGHATSHPVLNVRARPPVCADPWLLLTV